MKKRIKYTDEPMEFTIIPDFLPPPEELRKRLKKVKVTVEVDAPTVRVFREKAGGRGDDSRRMMGKLLDLYAARQSAGNR
jgi:hypothetical protein